MGVVGSQPTSCIPCVGGAGCFGIYGNDEVRLSRAIDRGIRDARRNLPNTPKILLLGAGESGKSTIIKQMRIINNVPFTEYERELFRVQVFYNLVGGMRSLLEAMKELTPLDELSDESNYHAGPSSSSNPLRGGGRPGTSAQGLGGAAGGVGGDAGAGVKRPKPAFVIDPPEEDGKDAKSLSLGSPSSEGRRELDGTSTLNTNPNHHDAHPYSHSTSGHSSPAGPSQIRPLSSASESLSPSITQPPQTASGSSPPHDAPRNTTQTPSPQDPDNITSTDNPNPSNDSNHSRAPTRSPSLSLNIFHPGALTQRQHAVLLNELHYVPDIRPAEPFPMEYEALLRGLWWGWEGHVQPDDGGPPVLRREAGVGQHLDRIQSETGIALPDNLTYFFESPKQLSEWFGDDYVPSDEDILRCRGRTTGIQETIFTLGKTGLGQALRERRKAVEAARGGAHAGAGVDETGTAGTGTTSAASGGTATATTSGAGGGGYGHGHGHGGHAAAGLQQPNSPLRISMGKTRLHLVDVGGQRSERRKWIHCFQDVTAVLFLVGLSGYSQGMLEDPRANQMKDAMALWDGVCSSEWFKQTSLILFLNKKDLFAEKMAKFPLKNYFPDYEGGETDVTAGMEFFKRKFLRLYAKHAGRKGKAGPATSTANTAKATRKGKERERERERERESEMGKGKGKGKADEAKGKGKEKADEAPGQRRAVYVHFTTATDTMQLRLVMVAVCDIILRDNLHAAHFL